MSADIMMKRQVSEVVGVFLSLLIVLRVLVRSRSFSLCAQAELEAKYEAMWDNGKGSHHPDYDPMASGDDVVKASRETEELLNAIIKNDIKLVYKKVMPP